MGAITTKDHNAFNSTPRAILNVNREGTYAHRAFQLQQILDGHFAPSTPSQASPFAVPEVRA